MILRHRESFTGPSINIRTPNSHLAATVLAVPWKEAPPSSNKGKPHISRRTMILGLVGLTTLGLAGGITWSVRSHLFAHPTSKPSHSTSSPSPTPSSSSIPLGTTLHTYRGHTDVVAAVAWSSPGGAYIATASADKTVQIWNAADGSSSYTYSGHSDAVYAVSWSPDSTRIASGGAEKTVQV